MRAMTDKRREELAIYSVRGAAFRARHPWCGRCKKRRTTEIHHELGRLGPLLLDERHWRPRCSKCHRREPGHANSKGPRTDEQKQKFNSPQ